MWILTGTNTQAGGAYRNPSALFGPDWEIQVYHKRALWGWDQENFCSGDTLGVFDIAGWKVGVRICYEVRFPEYFRELYRADADLILLLFYDVADAPNAGRYDLIRGHTRTRAVENSILF